MPKENTPAHPNPVLDDAGTHYGVARFQFVKGRMQQLFCPTTREGSAEWREVPTADDDQPVDPEPPVWP